jgi:hypothetical protein
LAKAIDLYEKAINLARNEESIRNICSMYIGAKSQAKILEKYGKTSMNEVLSELHHENLLI